MLCLRHEHSLFAQEIVESSGLPKNTVSRSVQRLLNRELIARTAHPTDGRKALLSISPEGQILLAELLPRFVDRRNRLVSTLEPHERDLLSKLLAKAARGAEERLEPY